MADKEKWQPELSEDALKALIRATVMNAGSANPDELPFKIKERLKGQATGNLDVESCIREILAETKKKS